MLCLNLLCSFTSRSVFTDTFVSPAVAVPLVSPFAILSCTHIHTQHHRHLSRPAHYIQRRHIIRFCIRPPSLRYMNSPLNNTHPALPPPPSQPTAPPPLSPVYFYSFYYFLPPDRQPHFIALHRIEYRTPIVFSSFSSLFSSFSPFISLFLSSFFATTTVLAIQFYYHQYNPFLTLQNQPLYPGLCSFTRNPIFINIHSFLSLSLLPSPFFTRPSLSPRFVSFSYRSVSPVFLLIFLPCIFIFSAFESLSIFFHFHFISCCSLWRASTVILLGPSIVHFHSRFSSVALLFAPVCACYFNTHSFFSTALRLFIL